MRDDEFGPQIGPPPLSEKTQRSRDHLLFIEGELRALNKGGLNTTLNLLFVGALAYVAFKDMEIVFFAVFAVLVVQYIPTAIASHMYRMEFTRVLHEFDGNPEELQSALENVRFQRTVATSATAKFWQRHSDRFIIGLFLAALLVLAIFLPASSSEIRDWLDGLFDFGGV